MAPGTDTHIPGWGSASEEQPMKPKKLIKYLREMEQNPENDIVAHLGIAADKLEGLMRENRLLKRVLKMTSIHSTPVQSGGAA